MTDSAPKTSLPKIYSITSLAAFIYAAFMIIFLIYKQFFYVDGTWFHGLTVNSLAVLSSVVWLGILIVFKLFLNRVLKYNKADSLIIAYLVFLSISIYSVGMVLFNSIKLYVSLENGQDSNALMSFSSTSISSAFWLILSTVVLIVVTILLGNRIRKIAIIQKDLFKILGFSFIVLGVGSVLQLVHIVNNDIIVFLPKAFTLAVLGYLLKEACKMNPADLPSSPESEVSFTPKTHNPIKNSSQNAFENIEKITVVKKNKDVAPEQNAIPNIDLNEFENKEKILSYFNNLTKDELNRLEVIVAKDYNQNLTEEQKKNLVIYHIADKKLYDHNRYAPK